MKLGAYTAVLDDKPVAEALGILRDMGLDSAEINSGGFLPAPHLPIADIKASKVARGNNSKGCVTPPAPSSRHRTD